MSFKYKITLFTPTYNRAYILEKLYRSIQRQTFKDFEWIVVDDGSTDNTEAIIKEWKKEDNFFPIRYYKKENGGKCRAINYALDLAEGELFFTMDSDDYLTDNALERVAYWESTISDKHMFAGVMGNRGTSENYSPNSPLGAPYIDDNALIRYSIVDGERADVWYTEIHKKYKYPEFDGEKFLTECIAWNRMANDGYKIRVFDEIIWICNYRNDGLTKKGSTVFIENPQGHGLMLEEKSKFMRDSLIKKVKTWYGFYCDHTFCDEKYRLTKKQCADYIGAPLFMIYASAIIHKALK